MQPLIIRKDFIKEEKEGMKFKIKKLVLYALVAILSFFLLTCFPGPDDYEEFVLPEFTDVEYSPDGGYVTIYLDGSAPVRNSRALNLKWAQVGFDFFEVAFYHPTTGTARAVWETGHAAGVNGVARGFNYASATVPAAPAGQGAAILFVGKKSDKTLLAVGRLTHVNNGTGTAPGSTVTADTRSVTFSVAALSAGVNVNRKISSFKTAARENNGVGALLTAVNVNDNDGSNTEVFPIMIGRQLFPIFRLNKGKIVGQSVDAEYTFDGEGDLLGTYHNGILQSGPIALMPADTPIALYHLDPRYPIGDGTHESSTIPMTTLKDNTTPVTIRNPAPSGTGAFQNPVQFRFNTIIDANPVVSNNGKIFALAFQIPVYSLTNAGSPGTWYLRPGYDSYLYDLDNGRGGTGGAVLIGTGDVEGSLQYNVHVARPPSKRVYRSSDPANLLALLGIQVNLRAGNDNVNYIVDNLLSIPPDTFENQKVSFYFGAPSNASPPGIPMDCVWGPAPNFDPLPAVPPLNTNNIQTLVGLYPGFLDASGIIKIYVEYDDANTATTYRGFFEIFWDTSSGTPDSDAFINSNRLVIASPLDLVNFGNMLNNNALPNRNFVVVFYDSFDLPLINPNASFYLILIAGKENLTLGKAQNDVIRINNLGSSIWVGVWPFNDTLAVGGKAVTSYPFTVHTAGTVADPNAYPGGYFINRGGYAVTVEDAPGVIKIGNNFSGN
jgi:hypothetical protein